MFETIILQPIFNALLLIYSIIPGGDFGVAVILFTVIIRFLLYPLLKRQLHQSKQMRKMQPELAKIKKAANGNRQVEAMQQMELYKKYGIKPFRSILLLFIQIPIFIGLYQVIMIISLHRDQVARYIYEPLKNIDAIKTIINHPDQFNHTMLGFIDLTKVALGKDGIVWPLLALAIISALTQYVMTKQTMPTGKSTKRFRDIMKETAAGKEADPSEMNAAMMRNMAKFMPVMMFMIMMGLPGALALYYTASNLVAVAQQSYLLRKDKQELEAIADEVDITPPAKKKSTKKRAKAATEANITRIKAKE